MPTKAEIQAALDSQNRVIAAVADMLTGSAIQSEDLRHYNVARWAFKPQLDATISRLVDSEFGRPEFARDLLVASMLHTAERLLSPQPGAVEVRQRRKKEPVKSVCRSTRNYRDRILRMSPEELAAFREKERARLREYHKRRKAAKLAQSFVGATKLSH